MAQPPNILDRNGDTVTIEDADGKPMPISATAYKNTYGSLPPLPVASNPIAGPAMDQPPAQPQEGVPLLKNAFKQVGDTIGDTAHAIATQQPGGLLSYPTDPTPPPPSPAPAGANAVSPQPAPQEGVPPALSPNYNGPDQPPKTGPSLPNIPPTIDVHMKAGGYGGPLLTGSLKTPAQIEKDANASEKKAEVKTKTVMEQQAATDQDYLSKRQAEDSKGLQRTEDDRAQKMNLIQQANELNKEMAAKRILAANEPAYLRSQETTGEKVAHFFASAFSSGLIGKIAGAFDHYQQTVDEEVNRQKAEMENIKDKIDLNTNTYARFKDLGLDDAAATAAAATNITAEHLQATDLIKNQPAAVALAQNQLKKALQERQEQLYSTASKSGLEQAETAKTYEEMAARTVPSKENIVRDANGKVIGYSDTKDQAKGIQAQRNSISSIDKIAQRTKQLGWLDKFSPTARSQAASDYSDLMQEVNKFRAEHANEESSRQMEILQKAIPNPTDLNTTPGAYQSAINRTLLTLRNNLSQSQLTSGVGVQ